MTLMSTGTLLLVGRFADGARHGRPRNLSADRTQAQSAQAQSAHDAFLDGIIAARKPADCTEMFRRAVAHSGINAFASGEADHRAGFFPRHHQGLRRARHVRDNEVRKCLQVLS